MRRLFLRQDWQRLRYSLMGAIGCGLIVLLLGRWAPLTHAQELEAAEARWAARPFSRYHLVLAEDYGRCLQVLEVQDEQVVKNLRNTCRIPSRSITALFRMADSLRPTVYRCVEHGCACDTVLSTRAAYDERLGYPIEISFHWEVRANWRHPDFWRYTWLNGRPPICRPTTFSRATSVLSMTPMP